MKFERTTSTVPSRLKRTYPASLLVLVPIDLPAHLFLKRLARAEA